MERAKAETVGELVAIGLTGLALRDKVHTKDPVTNRSPADNMLTAYRAARRNGTMDRPTQEALARDWRFRRGRYP